MQDSRVGFQGCDIKGENIMKDLTPRQQEVFDWIRAFIRDNGMPPTVREIGRAFGIKSSSVFDLLKALEKKGCLRRGDLGARSLIIEDDHMRKYSGCVDIPIVGRIAAGKPILAVEDRAGTITVDRSLVHDHEAYALHVEGNSMVDAGILDGDYVVIRAQDDADDGDIVVALIEDEATLKKFYREKNQVRLEPANRGLKPIRVSSGEFRVQGKVVAVHRKL